jgi:LPS-assembly protein
MFSPLFPLYPFCSAPRRHVLALAALLCVQQTALAQTVKQEAQQAPVQSASPGFEPAPTLKPSPLLSEEIPKDLREQLPTFIEGERIRGQTNIETVIEGDARLRRADTSIRAERIEYYQPGDLARARGNVRINRAGNVFEGTELQLRVDAFDGFFLNPRYEFFSNQTQGQAERIDFVDDQRLTARKATLHSSIMPRSKPPEKPNWVLEMERVRLDNETEVGEAEGAVLRFKGVPILAAPYLTFPLSDRRKSGFLPPSINIDSLSGFEYSQPYYWNIAPNRDATFYPAVLTKRGIDLGGEFRYLEDAYSGQARAAYMPNDRLRNRERWGLAYTHNQAINSGWSFAPAWNLGVSLNRVSDDNYWSDFPRSITSLTQRLLANDANLGFSNGPWSFNARALKWQTLQDAAEPIVPPYDRLPSIGLNYVRSNWSGLDLSITSDFSRFQSSPLLTGQPNGQRSYVQAQVSRPWVTPGGFLVPKLQLHATRYGFDAPLATGQTSANRVLPTFSLDSGLVFERSANLFGRDVLQTLEPRAFYVRTPFRDQNFLPNYDSALNDFNFATIWSENAFGGHDRIADTNVLTLGLGSRYLSPQTGAEWAHLRIAQRLRFTPQTVVLPGGVPATEKFSDTLLGATLSPSERWAFDSTVQYSSDIQRSVRTTVGARYSPGNYRTLSAAYRLQRGQSEQLDLGWQWPLANPFGPGAGVGVQGEGLGAGRWYSVSRLNYSLRDGKLVDGVVGFEYDGGDWVGRFVFERLQRSSAGANSRILLQLELVGLSRLGSNSLKTLQQNIPRYQLLREQTTKPSRFGTYE